MFFSPCPERVYIDDPSRFLVSPKCHLVMASKMMKKALVLVLGLLMAISCTNRYSHDPNNVFSRAIESIYLSEGATDGQKNELKMFGDAYGLIRKNYLWESFPDQLLEGAIAAMEQWLEEKDPGFKKEKLDVHSVSSDETEQLRYFARAYLHMSPGSTSDRKPLVYAAIRGMVSRLGPDCSFYTPDWLKKRQDTSQYLRGGIGIQIKGVGPRGALIVPLAESPAQRIGIPANDIVTEINRRSTGGQSLEEILELLRGRIGEVVVLTIERPGEIAPLTFEIVREEIKSKDLEAKLLENSIGYVKLIQIQESTPREMLKILQSFQPDMVKGLIVDLRNNEGGLLTATVEIAEQFLPPGKKIVSLEGPNGEKDAYHSSRNSIPWRGPLMILVNKQTASGAEIIAAALQDWLRAEIIGTPTAGVGTVQTIIPLKAGGGIRMPVAKVYRPNDQPLNSISNIQPDVVVHEEEGRDAPLLVAIQRIRSTSPAKV